MTHLIQIGNSQGVRIPKSMIHQAGLENVDLVLQVVPEGLLVRPSHVVRQGWEEACKMIHKEKADEVLLDDRIVNQFDKDEWE